MLSFISLFQVQGATS